MKKINLASFLFLEVLISFELIWGQLSNQDELSAFHLWGPIILHYIGVFAKIVLISKPLWGVLWLICAGFEGIFIGLISYGNSNLTYMQALLLIQFQLYYDSQYYFKQAALLLYCTSISQIMFNFDSLWRLLSLLFEFVAIFSFLFFLNQKFKTPMHILEDQKKQEVIMSQKQIVLKLMPWLTDQKFMVLSDQYKLLYNQSEIYQLIELDGDDAINFFLSLRCETCSPNLIRQLYETNTNISPVKLYQSVRPEIKTIITALLSDMNSYYSFYSAQDIDHKNLVNQKLNFIILSDNFVDYVIIHFEHVTRTHYFSKSIPTINRVNNTNPSNNSKQTHETISSFLLSNIFKSVSHEFGTFLNCILTVSQEAMSNEVISEQVKQLYVEPIYINAKLLQYILQNIRDFNSILLKQFALRLQEFNPYDILDEILYLLEQQKKQRNNEIIVNCPINFLIYNDFERLRQVIYQLLSNSMRFTQNGTITIDIQRNKDIVEISVADTGIGMNEQEQKKLRDLLKDNKKLLRVSHNSVGCGLGLSISNAIVMKMSGRSGIKFRSQQNNGSLFYFSIMNSEQLYNDSVYAPSLSYFKVLNQTYYVEQQPCSEDSQKGFNMSVLKEDGLDTIREKKQTFPKRNNSTDSRSFFIKSLKHQDEDDVGSREEQHILIPSLQTSLKSEILKFSISSNCCSRIMIVDDEYFNIKSLQLILNKFHSHCDFAFNGQECIRKCLEKTKKPCRQCQNNGYVVFFLDLNMPIMDGFYTVKNLKGMMRDNVIPKGVCIANTGYADLESKQKALNEGMDYYLTKPIEIKELESYLKVKFPH